VDVSLPTPESNSSEDIESSPAERVVYSLRKEKSKLSKLISPKSSKFKGGGGTDPSKIGGGTYSPKLEVGGPYTPNRLGSEDARLALPPSMAAAWGSCI
jgi:hypothetical protein